MGFSTRAVALASTVWLASCGGGGGGGGSVSVPITPSTPQTAITESNAKPVGASALDTAQNTSASQSTGLVTAVEIQATALPNSTLSLARAAASLAASVPARAALPTAAIVNETAPCALGGTMTLSGTVAGGTSLVTGDTVTISATNCSAVVDGVTSTMNGSMSFTVAGGSVSQAPPFHVVMDVTLSNLVVQTGGTSVTGNGDMHVDLTATSPSIESLTVSGIALTSRTVAGTTSHTVTLRNYNQSIAINGTTATASISAAVESDSARLGASGGAYTISTPTAVVWNTLTKSVSAGAIKVVGASNSQLLLTVGTGNTVTLQVDANGDGTYEKSIGSTVAELSALL